MSISSIANNNNVITTPLNARYVRFCDDSVSAIGQIQLEYGTESSQYNRYSAMPMALKSEKNSIPFQKILASNNIDVYKDNAGDLHACLGDVYARHVSGKIIIYPNGLNADFYIVSFDANNFPGLIENSTVLRIFILPFTRNATTSWSGQEWRSDVVTNKGQVYHNFPSRSTTSDGIAQANDHILFDEGCIWDLPERWAPVKTKTGTDAELIATGKYRYFPALADTAYTLYPSISHDNGYGNNGFPSVLEKINQLG